MITTEDKNFELIQFLESRGFPSLSIDGYKVISNYTNLEQELDSIYQGAALRNISHYGIIELKGKDSLDLLHRISTNSVQNLPKEGITNTIFTSEKGRIIGLTTLLNFENYQLLVCDRANKLKIMSWIRKYVISDDVEVNDANTKYNILELTGPQANSFATLVCGNVVDEIQPNSFKIIHTENILFFIIKLAGERNRNKFWFLADLENTKRLYNYMNENKGVFNFSMIGEQAYEIYRIEQGIPVGPNELNDEFNPHEAGLIDYVDFKKGCYIGQEVIARLQTYDKVQKKLVGVKFSQPTNNGAEYILVNEEGIEVGKVTSVVHSPKLNKQIGLAYIRNSHIQPGSKLNVKNSDNGSSQVEVQPLPFVK